MKRQSQDRFYQLFLYFGIARADFLFKLVNRPTTREPFDWSMLNKWLITIIIINVTLLLLKSAQPENHPLAAIGSNIILDAVGARQKPFE